MDDLAENFRLCVAQSILKRKQVDRVVKVLKNLPVSY